MSPQQNTYNQVADNYAQYLSALREQHFSFNHDLVIPALLEVAGDVTGLKVFDAGCGEGIVARQLASQGARVTAIDVAERLIELAREQDPTGTITYVAHDLSQPLPQYVQAFDLVVSNLVLNDVPDYFGFIATLGDVTKPGGRVVLSINNPYSALIREKIENYFDVGQAPLYNMARDGVAVYYYHHTLEEYIAAFRQAGFLLSTLIDIRVPQEIVDNLPDRYKHLSYWRMYAKFPFFLVIEFVKQYS